MISVTGHPSLENPRCGLAGSRERTSARRARGGLACAAGGVRRRPRVPSKASARDGTDQEAVHSKLLLPPRQRPAQLRLRLIHVPLAGDQEAAEGGVHVARNYQVLWQSSVRRVRLSVTASQRRTTQRSSDAPNPALQLCQRSALVDSHCFGGACRGVQFLVRAICVCTCVAPHQVSCAAEKTVTLARARCGAMRGGLILQLLRSEQLQRTRSSRRL